MAKEIRKINAPEEGSYEGNPTISIPLASGRPFSFGCDKAAAIVKHIDAIRNWSNRHPFVSKNQKTDVAGVVAAMSAEDRAQLAALLGMSK